jgi:hypothetical protein
MALRARECQGNFRKFHAQAAFRQARTGRDPDDQRLPLDGSAIVMWDSGTPTPPTTNTPPRAGEDSHEHPRRTRAARDMNSAFLRVGGSVVNTWASGPCLANGWTP